MKKPAENEIYQLDIPAQLDMKEAAKRITTGKTSPRYHKILEELAATAIATTNDTMDCFAIFVTPRFCVNNAGPKIIMYRPFPQNTVKAAVF